MENAPVRHLLPVLRRNPDPLKDEIVKRELPILLEYFLTHYDVFNVRVQEKTSETRNRSAV